MGDYLWKERDPSKEVCQSETPPQVLWHRLYTIVNGARVINHANVENNRTTHFFEYAQALRVCKKLKGGSSALASVSATKAGVITASTFAVLLAFCLGLTDWHLLNMVYISAFLSFLVLISLCCFSNLVEP